MTQTDSPSNDKRERLVEAARNLFHQQGFKHTSLAEIARASGIPVGNVYYYFKTKEALGAAVVAGHNASMRHATTVWDALPEPRARLHAFLDMLTELRETITEYGCPVGSLCQELNKEALTQTLDADAILRTQLDWVSSQFHQLGHKDTDATALGEQFIASLQGISLLANTLKDVSLVERQVLRLRHWLDRV